MIEVSGWEPDLLFARLERLGTLAVQANWSFADAHSAIHRWAEQFAATKHDTEDIVREAKEKLSYQLTRRVLAQQKPIALPSGVEAVDLVAAYQSEAELKTVFDVENAHDEKGNPALKLGQKIAIPVIEKDAEQSLERAIVLAGDSDLRHKRTRVFDLQNKILTERRPTLDMFFELEQASENFADFVKLALTNVRFTFVFTLAAISPGSAVGIPLKGFASRSTPLSSVVFRAREPFFAALPGAPTVMYHG